MPLDLVGSIYTIALGHGVVTRIEWMQANIICNKPNEDPARIGHKVEAAEEMIGAHFFFVMSLLGVRVLRSRQKESCALPNNDDKCVTLGWNYTYLNLSSYVRCWIAS
jgi:hypothetical protein